MAIFEQKITRKVLLDDTVALKCFIENYHNINGHTEYIIRVQRGPSRDRSWHVYKRYNDFVGLHGALAVSGVPLPLPPKRLIGNMDRDFISERQHALQLYLNAVLMNPILASSLTTKKFVDPDNYSAPLHEIALQQTSLSLRGEVGWEVVGPLQDVGWRLRKHYFQVRCRSREARGDEQLWASWLDYGPDKHLDDKDMQSVMKSLAGMQHPYVAPLELAVCTEVGALCVRRVSLARGSLRDLLGHSRPQPQHTFLKKYGNPRGHRPLSARQVALYGRQVLEALRFLQDKGLPYGHLHTGNLTVDEDGRRVRLLDVENGVLGVPSFYRPYFVQHRRIHTLHAIDVYCLGHTLYEMAFGSPLHESVCDSYPDDCPPLLRSVLVSILSTEACKGGLPTVEALQSHPFFASENVAVSGERCHLKLAAGVKEQLRSAQTLTEERLREEQRMVRSQKRLVKVQEMMSSEEEKKKRKHKARQEQRQREEAARASAPVGERADSANSSSTAAGDGTDTPPAPAPAAGLGVMCAPPPPPPPAPPLMNGGLASPPQPPPPPQPDSLDRSALLGSICAFNKANLRRTTSQQHK